MKKKLLSIAFLFFPFIMNAQVVVNNGTYPADGYTKKIIFSNLKMDNGGPKALIVTYSFDIFYAGRTDKYFFPSKYCLVDLKTQSIVKSYTFSEGCSYSSSLDDLFKVVDYNQDGYDDLMILLGDGKYTIISLTNTVTKSTAPKSNIDFTQNYPNPFREQTAIKYKLKNSDFVSIRIFDINGKEITSMINQTIPAGDYTAQIADAKLESGTYYYQVQIGNEFGVKKMIKY
jgi:hypothetical protein